MGANILWRPAGGGCDLGVYAPSSFIEAMGRAFGDHPWQLGSNELERLRGLAAGFSGDDNPFGKLFDIITENGAVEVWPQW